MSICGLPLLPSIPDGRACGCPDGATLDAASGAAFWAGRSPSDSINSAVKGLPSQTWNLQKPLDCAESDLRYAS